MTFLSNQASICTELSLTKKHSLRSYHSKHLSYVCLKQQPSSVIYTGSHTVRELTHTSDYQKDELKTDVNFRVPGFYKKIKKINKTMYDKKYNLSDPAVIVRQQGSNSFSGQKVSETPHTRP